MHRGMCDSSQIASKEKRGTFQEQFLHFWHFIVQRSIHVAVGSTLYSCTLVEYVSLRIRFPPYSIIGKGANLGKLSYSTMPMTPSIRVGGLKFGLFDS